MNLDDITLSDGTVIVHKPLSSGAREAIIRDDPERAMTSAQWDEYCATIRWMNLYEQELRREMKRKPEDYHFSADEVPTVVSRMTAAHKRGSASMQSNVPRRVCAALNVPCRVNAIRTFLLGGAAK